MKKWPRHPDDLTNEWLSATLGYDTNDFDVVHFSEGAGVMSWVMRILISAGAEKPSSVIAKFPSPSRVNREGAKRYDMYEREVNFYRNIAKTTDVITPRCIFGEFDSQTDEFLILLEDLSHWKIGDQVKGCNLQEAETVVKALARFHASGWEPNKFRDIPSHGSFQQIEGMRSTYPLGWPSVIKEFGRFIPSSMRADGEKIPEHISKLLGKMCESPVCITHADVRLDNIFFKDNSVALVDWQSTCTSAPEQDLAYFITQSVPQSIRDQESLVALYHDELINHGIDYDINRCRERYKYSALYLICYAVVIAGTLDLGNERGHLLGETIIKNTFSALEEIDALSLLRQL